MTGDFKVAAFTDIWGGRLAGDGGDFAAAAYYQSLITGIGWGNLFGSRFLSELKQASDPTLLSIKFNVDGFDQTAHVGRLSALSGRRRQASRRTSLSAGSVWDAPRGRFGTFAPL
jgi:hypothetical protein